MRALLREVENARIHGRDFGYALRSWKPTHILYDGKHTMEATCSLRGVHQPENLSTAIACAEEILHQPPPVKRLKRIFLPCRLECIQEEPPWILDGAHNPGSVRVLVRSLKTLYPGLRFQVVFGVLRTKDYATMVKLLKPLASRWILLPPPDSPHPLPAEELLPLVGGAQIASEPSEALAQLSPSEPVLVTGSLYLTGAMRDALGLAPRNLLTGESW